ncbi:MAG TPA: carboxypeptidase regulatory-like domain-containing protein [Micropepsaceae bacterium]|nr:carboxypeptidase regulatory-like domain-containing protein [Micropepsaceae bacterium]
MFSHRSRILALVAAVAPLVSVHSLRAEDLAGNVQGVVKSASGQALPGAYVKLINPERRLTFMAVTQAQGRYSMNNLPPGNYTVQGIGNGFQSKPMPVALTAGKPAMADVSLTDTQGPVVANGWVRTPGRVAGNELDSELAPPKLPEGPGKAIVEAKCNQCHFLHRLTQERWTRANWQQKITWMRERIHERGANDLTDQEQKIVVDYLATNFSDKAPRAEANGRLSRTLLKGDAAKYIAMDFAGPNPDAAFHDIAVDARGVAWANQLNLYALAKFDPKTFTFSEVRPPDLGTKPGTLAHMGPPTRGSGDSIWMADIGGTRRWLEFNTKTEKFNSVLVPDDFKGPISGNFMRADPNGKMVWTTAGTRIVGLNIQTKQFAAYDIPTKNPGAYGMDVAGDGRVWFVEREAYKVGRLDPATGKMDEFPTPGKDVPRRMGADWEGNLWVGFHETGKLVKVDQKTGKMTFYDPPTKNSGMYLPVPDARRKVIWVTEQTADKIARFDPKTETWTEFSLPIAESDARRIELDPSNPNRIWWSGDTSSHLGYIEVLDK